MPEPASNSDHLRALLALTADIDFGSMLAEIAHGMRYDPELEAVVIPVPNTPDEVFDGDPNLRRGPLTMAGWYMALLELADRLPPWTDD